MTERRKLTTLDRLKIMVRQAICPECREVLGKLDDCEFDHQHQLAMGGADELDNLFAKHKKCHKAKTVRDAKARAKTRRIAGKKADRFKAPLMGVNVDAEPEAKAARRHPMQGRGFDRRWRKKVSGEVERRT